MIEVFLDIETVPGDNMPSIDEVKIPGNIKKEETKQKWLAENGEAALDKLYRAQALDSMRGKIFCTSLAIEDDEPFTVFNMTDLYYALRGIRGPVFIGYNARAFDMVWIFRHSIKQGERHMARMIDFNPYQGNIRDPMKMWSCGQYNDFVKMDVLAEFLGVPRKSEGIDGSKVWDYVKAGKGDVVVKYCEQDVRVVRGIYRKVSV